MGIKGDQGIVGPKGSQGLQGLRGTVVNDYLNILKCVVICIGTYYLCSIEFIQCVQCMH